MWRLRHREENNFFRIIPKCPFMNSLPSLLVKCFFFFFPAGYVSLSGWSVPFCGLLLAKGLSNSSRCNGHELEQSLGDGEGLESLVRCSPWGREELDMT